jgi:predicted MPP superfamily phosphohydrolase
LERKKACGLDSIYCSAALRENVLALTEKVSMLAFLIFLLAIFITEAGLIAGIIVNLARGEPFRPLLVSRQALAIHILAFGVLACLLYAYFAEPYWIEVKKVEIETPKLDKAVFRIVQISDMHCDTKPRNEARVVELINAMEPDITVFTGDSINTPSALPLFKNTMKSLKAKLAKIAVRGNFDVWYWHDLDLYGDTGFEVLDKGSKIAGKDGEEIMISGLSCANPDSMKDVLSGVGKDRFSVFAYHYSDFAESMADLNVDLYLSGHTHGGQVALPLYGAVITLSKFGKKYEAGQYTIGNMILYVNRGIGMEAGHAPRVRFFARPEITVFEIRGKQVVNKMLDTSSR